MPLALTDEMARALDNALVDRSPCLVATASLEGMPDVSYRGSMMVFDNEHLAFWERAKGETLSNLQENPGVCVFYRNAETRASWRFYGVAEVLKGGPIRTQIMERVNQFELAQDPERTGYAILVRVDRVRARNETIMQRD
ncbi:MAG: pyridoxamine 5'-phosphate oxidase family protein [Chloroflexota bacterium]|nr:pyridoxamine 5'-phosphate oxidase family protein [Chloroflexota bacterium]